MVGLTRFFCLMNLCEKSGDSVNVCRGFRRIEKHVDFWEVKKNFVLQEGVRKFVLVNLDFIDGNGCLAFSQFDKCSVRLNRRNRTFTNDNKPVQQFEDYRFESGSAKNFGNSRFSYVPFSLGATYVEFPNTL